MSGTPHSAKKISVDFWMWNLHTQKKIGNLSQVLEKMKTMNS